MLALLLVLIALAVSLSGALERVDHLLFDLGQRLNRRALPENVVLVAIDEDSLGRIGRWPWSRAVHARMLHKLCAAHPAVVGFDIAFTERSADAQADSALAQAMAQCGNVVLPLVIETTSLGGQVLESPPIAELAAVAAGLGRVGVRLDGDGIARSVDLREGVARASWPLFAEELLRVARGQPRVETSGELSGNGSGLVREGARRLEFVGPPGSIPRISYARLLDGDVPPDVLAGKLVLIGVTAVGLGDFLPTPVSANAQPMPGVEVQANVWLSMRDQRLSRSLPPWGNALLCSLLALVPFVWLSYLMPLAGLLASTAWILLLCIVSALLPGSIQFWIAPSGALVAALSAFPLWSWRRLEAARRHLDQELRQLGAILPESGATSPAAVRQMGFEQRIAWVQAAQRRMQNLETQRNEALAFISHDLRSPLASALQRLEYDPSCPAAEVLPALRRAQGMAQDFLHLARAEALEARQMKDLELVALLQQAADELYPQAEQRGQRISCLLPEAAYWVRGDFSALERCAINLLQNALNYAPPGSVIDLGLESRPGEVRFQVVNDGAQFSKEELGRLFLRFSRGGQAVQHSQGSGLGLYYVRTVAEKHGGAVGVECADGRIKFWLALPWTESRQ